MGTLHSSPWGSYQGHCNPRPSVDAGRYLVDVEAGGWVLLHKQLANDYYKYLKSKYKASFPNAASEFDTIKWGDIINSSRVDERQLY